ncbi:sporulation protein YqfC [Paenibacillus sp. YN15]|uniref:sporulation protein YqfC n=1 Tax=Paenibacillus sp. YN15 TaxID=1742774 RepID=UPI000DCC8C12|nr:sporulation protein YqfC [Paenibacillus sp. YN15]RAU99247.1 sporulation protein YqfC [Paenibacillus sp. YN15]
MRRIRKKFDQWTAGILDVPEDIAQDIPRLIMIGNVRLQIENHRGVLHFSEERLLLTLSRGSLEILGSNLSIRTIMAEEVLVEGVIRELKYIP